MKFIFIMFMVLCALSVDAENIETISKLHQASKVDMERMLESVVEKTHQISSARMQRVLEHQQKFGPYIVGGREAELNAYPWVASLAYYDSSGQLSSYCGGSLIARTWLLTAAHCEVYTSDFVIIGRHDLTTSNGKIYEVNRFIPHPS